MSHSFETSRGVRQLLTRLRVSGVETDLERMAREALERVKRAQKEQATPKRNQGPTTHCRSVRSFNLIWTELHGLSERYDVDALSGRVERQSADSRG